MSDHTSVGRLLVRTFGVLVALILLSGTAGVAASALQHRSAQQLTGYVLPLRVANAKLRSVLADAQRGLRGYLLTGDPVLLSAFDSARTDYPRVQAQVRSAADDREGAAVDEQARRAQAWWTLAGEQREVPPGSAAAAGYVARGQSVFNGFLTANDKLDAHLAQRAADLLSRSNRLRIVIMVALSGVTVLAGLLAVVAAGVTTRRITGPLHRLATVVDRLGAGDHQARAGTDDGPSEVRQVASAVNSMAEHAARVRREEEVAAGLHRAARSLGIRIRQHLAVLSALQEATRGLGEMLDADHVLVRLAGEEPDGATVVCWNAQDSELAGDRLAEIAGLGLDWLAGCGGSWVVDEVRQVTDDPPPAVERRALVEAGAGPVATVAVGTGGDDFGGITLVRARGRQPWSVEQTRILESVAADLGRGVRQAQTYEREQQLVQRLKELDNAKTDFMSTVSHELRTPLTSIAGYVEMLRDGDAGAVNAGQDKMLDVIDRNTKRLRALIGDLLILSKIEAGTFKTQRKIVDLAGVAATATTAIAPLAAKSGMRVCTDIDAPLELPADAEQLDRVLTNLLSNAVKFSPAGALVHLRGHRDGADVVISVADSGMGIPESEQDQLFSRFFRASNAVHLAVPGTGLGLAIVHTIVQNHGGRIDIVSREGDGTTVTVRLPAE